MKRNKNEHKKENNIKVCINLDIPVIDKLKIIEEFYYFVLKNEFDANSIYTYLEYKKHLLDNIK